MSRKTHCLSRLMNCCDQCLPADFSGLLHLVPSCSIFAGPIDMPPDPHIQSKFRVCRPQTFKGGNGRDRKNQGGPKQPDFLFIKDRPYRPPQGTTKRQPPDPTNHQPPPITDHQPPPTTANQPPTANHYQPPPTTNHQPPTAANHHQLPPTASCQLPPANHRQAPTANRHQPWLNTWRSFWENCVTEHFLFFPLRTTLARTGSSWSGLCTPDSSTQGQVEARQVHGGIPCRQPSPTHCLPHIVPSASACFLAPLQEATLQGFFVCCSWSSGL